MMSQVVNLQDTYQTKNMNEANEELNYQDEQRYQDFQEWLSKCPLVVTDYQDYTTEFTITFNLEAD